ncbi:MAG TPA: HEAT repeat domain-containing protein, partial [Anaerolineae bacterium]|nr:HEAT repeat domain-containing protein [Anaerolineae bacterium]
MADAEKSSEELPALVQELICGDDERAEQAALKISLRGCEALVDLRPVVIAADPDRRWWAARVLGQMRCAEAYQQLIALLRDPDDDV